ncbi:propanediol/glycerol family dehydratase large subunit [Clostridium perfringens]|uniref:propanediol/glycerol family dehydratase large subunit n=1 Tax=Clostridium perfringens TaxID=1502 RepID=UPI0013E30452|nr:propanediol/glycerol family dehydratase large subunit [Clostridium perfringens]MCX0386138.1 propanediol/glycerol family dehydratase large subunit [Clostridium perfringens]MDT7932074.1 propanediol/glycerol family dehydratase large subunit [Clostridium perfringens]MDT7955554.1 propanediol/glycerol family dehydratase large subunit [Clostridium perfringens]NGT55588.1 propanediol/glycerol family dehydratase large subunit [Clostridium perfringens]
MKSKRFQVLSERPVNQDGLIGEWADEGLIALDSPNDPKSSIKIENGIITELDGRSRDEFDMIDKFIAEYAINIEDAEASMKLSSKEIARRLVDINVSRDEIVKITTSITPMKAVEVIQEMNVVEMMMALQKMRARRTPANQCHVTNVKDNPVQIAADAAEAALRGFAEQETTVGIVRYAPFNALAILVGSQVGRGGVLTQCAVEEATELDLGMRGLTSYAETVSVYGTESVFTDGDDTPWSKAFLASAYASRGLKMRFTSGSGSEALMGYSEGRSMLYLESRCIYITKGAGVQGLQNGAVSCIGMTGAVPSGIRAVLGENLIAAMLDIEVASANDQTFSHSDIRRTARMLMQMLPGTDFIFSGYSAVPNYDNMFAGSNFDAEDFDDYNILQRDLKVDGGLRPVTEEEAIKVRNKAAKCIQIIFRELGFPEVTDEEVEAATYCHGSKEMPNRNVVEDLKAAEEMLERRITGLDIIKALSKNGMEDIANNLLNMLKQRVTGDYLQTSAILDKDFNVISAVNDVNDYMGPGTGYRLDGQRWEEIKKVPTVMRPEDIE